jgi:hypothetical protein
LICQRERVRVDHVPWLVEMLAVNWARWRVKARTGSNDPVLQRLIFKCAADLGLSSKALRQVTGADDDLAADPDEGGDPDQLRVVYHFDRKAGG